MPRSVLDKILDNIFDAEWKGRYGERLTERELKLVSFFGRSGKVLRNVYIPKPNGETSEIDVLFITQKGIFVIESKNYSGWIFGNEKDRMWTVSLKGGHKERFYNPVKQNLGHMKWLAEYLGQPCPLFSIIAFSERCELKNITVESDVLVVKRDRLYATIRDIWDGAEDCLSETEIGELYEKLKALTDVSEAVKAAHVARVERYDSAREDTTARSNDDKPRKQTGQATQNEQEEQQEELEAKDAKIPADETTAQERSCPRCGGKLILRTARRGEHAGERFWGCERFPKCRYVEHL